MFFKQRPRQRPDFEKFPAQQLFILALIRVSEPIALTSIFPYAWKLVLHFNVGDRSNASFYAGILISAFALAEALTGMYWGAYSDRVGRKPVLLMGCVGTMLSLLVVGFSTSFWVALFGRALGGFLNGNIGVIQTMVGEMTVNPKHEPKAYSVMPFVWSIGTIIGPSIGGYFAAPADTYPEIFPADGVFGQFPYLLPNIVCAGMMLVSIVAGWFLLDETHPDMQPWSQEEEEEEAPNALHRTTTQDTETPLIPAQASMTAPSVNLAHEASYGTFNNVTVDHTEEWKVKSNGRPVSISSDSAGEKVFTRRIIMLTVALGIFTYHSMTYDHLLPIFFQDHRVGDITITGENPLAGGLGLSIQQVGVIMSVNGLIALVVQAVVFPIMAAWLGVWRLFLVVTVLHPVAYFIVPYIALLPEHLVYTGIYTCLTVRNILSIMAYPVLLILIKEAAPSHTCLGKINGLAASTGAGCRTIASPIAGYLYGVGIKIDYTAIAWFASAAVAVLGAFQAFWIEQKKSLEVHHVGSRLIPEEPEDEVTHINVREVPDREEQDERHESNERTRLLDV
ncbi:MFS transporter-like protein 132 [Elsinoe australis]|uniref:MFS transporter-like protein 132 n=1 Tax=Elsinoe australis TaxID=40998 RepID=A0A4U7AU32_9PEZI|nr:MFS transporter-like protein 132 [Elsinoe australis]